MNRSVTGPVRRVLMVVANPSVSTTLGWPVGFWASERTHAWYEFREAGYDTVIASPAGGNVEMDALSDPRDPSGYSGDDVISMGFLHTAALAGLLDATPAIHSLDANEFDAVYVAGGQSPMFAFRGHQRLQQLIRTFYERGRITAAVCHGTAALLDLRLSDGALLITGKHVTGFANSEEDYADRVVGTKVMPYRIEDEALRQGANFVAAPAFRPHAVRDGNLVTGQQQYSGRAVAQLIIEALGH